MISCARARGGAAKSIPATSTQTAAAVSDTFILCLFDLM
jgi:hypothetical protein